ncbi:MAG: hypothetical protein FWF08_06835 [Oscillospiraceae bacterium]|nr:hypothetical protein [Oscillospiraceae bacterium]
MIKGVNKQVVEIADTGAEYFEKAIFFVKPEFTAVTEGRLRESAKHSIDCAAMPPKIKEPDEKDGKLWFYVKLLIAAAAGAAVSAIICLTL